MYGAPNEIETTVFTRLPDKFRFSGKPTAWTQAARPGQVLHSFLEGPSFDRAGNLYCVDIPYGRIFRISPQGNWSLAAVYPGEPNGLKIHRDGRIFIADHLNGLMVMEPDIGTVEILHDRIGLERFRGLNDLFFASNGDLYFTDPGRSSLSDPTGRVFRLNAASGKLEKLLDNVPYPNGIVLNEAETHVLVAATRANAIWRFQADPDPHRQLCGLFIQMSGGYAGPDGVAMDDDGNLAVAHAQHGSVWLFSPMGEPLYRIRSCAGYALTNLAYGGSDRKTLYILDAETGSILTAQMPVPGRRMYSHV